MSLSSLLDQRTESQMHIWVCAGQFCDMTSKPRASAVFSNLVLQQGGSVPCKIDPWEKVSLLALQAAAPDLTLMVLCRLPLPSKGRPALLSQAHDH